MKKNLLMFSGKIKDIIFSTKKRRIITFLIVLVMGFLLWQQLKEQKQEVAYQTEKAAKGTLVITLSETGQVAAANKVSIVTQASGIVSRVYVQSGDTVDAGNKIAEVVLDTAGQQRQAQAYSSLLSAQNNLRSANAQLYTLQNQLFVANQKFVNDRGVNNPTEDQKNDPVYIEENAVWLAAEAAYNNQANVINQAQANVSNANLSYQLTSGTIVAPTAGVVSDLVITQGMQIGSSNTTAGSSTNTSNQQVATIKVGNAATITVNVAEADATKIKAGQKATIIFDAIGSKTFTGKVMGINTSGVTSSGVTSYPTVIQLDNTSDEDILPSMSATASIISKIKDNVLLIPLEAVEVSATESIVRILKNGKVTSVTVEAGDSSDSQIEITSGLSEGDEVITNYISASDANQNNTTSSFGSTSRGSNSTNRRNSSDGAGRVMMFGPGM
jgi:RND family efflux transporter MFP subunit